MPRIRFYGHACFRLEQGDVQVLIDPFFTGNPHIKEIPADLRPTNILVTHGHGDHLGDAIELAKANGATILATPELAGYCGRQGAAVDGAHMGGTVRFPWGSVKLVPAFHSSSVGPNLDIYAGNPVGMVVRFHGLTFYHAGDTCLFGDMRLIGEGNDLDVAYLPIGGHYTMDTEDALKAIELLRPRAIIPGHYNTWPVLEVDISAFKARVEAATRAKCVVLKPGEAYEAG